MKKWNRSLFLENGFVGIGMLLLHWFILWLAYGIWHKTGNMPGNGFFQSVYDSIQRAGDVPHYVHIAQFGYESTGDFANEIVFFPLFPMLMKLFYPLFGNYVISGIFVSNLCLVIGSIYFYQLLKLDYGRVRALEGMLLLHLFPVGFFMVGAYTESLFVMLMAMTLYYIRKEKWLLTGIIGFLAALSRSQGIVLLVPAVYEVCLSCRAQYLQTKSFKLKQFPWKTLGIFLIPIGTLLYFALNYSLFGKWNAFVEFQAAPPWYNSAHWIASNLSMQFGMAIDYPYLAIFIYYAQLLLYFCSMFLLFFGLKLHVRTSYLALGGAYIFLTYLHGWMISGPRYMLSCLPLYIILVANEKPGLRRAVAIFFAILSIPFTMWYFQGQAIM